MSKDWLPSLDPDRHTKAQEWIERLKRCGASDPEELVRSDFTTEVPQIARFFLLRLLAGEIENWLLLDDLIIDNKMSQAEDSLPSPFTEAKRALGKMQETGISKDEIGQLMQWVAYEAISMTLQLIENGSMSHQPGAPSWGLAEIDAKNQVTGRQLKGLHEDLLSFTEFDENVDGV
jgi:hypothetical protein